MTKKQRLATVIRDWSFFRHWSFIIRHCSRDFKKEDDHESTDREGDNTVNYKLLFVVILAPVLAGLLALAHPWTARSPRESVESSALTVAPVSAPEFPQDTQWVQSEPLKLSDLRGQVVIVHFWTFGCINCIHNYPVYKAWQEKYANKAVAIIGVHTPEFANEADAARVRAKARD